MKKRVVGIWLIVCAVLAVIYLLVPGFSLLHLPTPQNYIYTGMFLILTLWALGVLFMPKMGK